MFRVHKIFGVAVNTKLCGDEVLNVVLCEDCEGVCPHLAGLAFLEPVSLMMWCDYVLFLLNYCCILCSSKVLGLKLRNKFFNLFFSISEQKS